jgi:hypothetical protein
MDGKSEPDKYEDDLDDQRRYDDWYHYSTLEALPTSAGRLVGTLAGPPYLAISCDFLSREPVNALGG